MLNICKSFRQCTMHHNFLKMLKVFWLSHGRGISYFPVLNWFVSFPPLCLALMPCPIKGFFQLYTNTDHLFNDDFIHELFSAQDCCPRGSLPELSLPFMLLYLMFVYIDHTQAIGGHRAIKMFHQMFHSIIINPLINYVKSLYKAHMLSKLSYYNTLVALTRSFQFSFFPVGSWATQGNSLQCEKENIRNLPTGNASLVLIHSFPLFERTMNQECNRASYYKFKFHFTQTIAYFVPSPISAAVCQQSSLNFRGLVPTGILGV